MYADVDFFIALFKQDDWLKSSAEKIYRKHRDEIWTSTVALQELLLYAKREGLSPVELLEGAMSLVQVRETVITTELCLGAANLAKTRGMTTFDAFHALISNGDPIISSDKAYDGIGLKRVKLEEKQ